MPAPYDESLQSLKTDFENLKAEIAATPNTRSAIDKAKAAYALARERYELLKTNFGSEQEVVEFLETVSNFYFDVGYNHFHSDRNATVVCEMVGGCARALIDGVTISKGMQERMENAYQDWHWHGW